jgi:hypothetical protein
MEGFMPDQSVIIYSEVFSSEELETMLHRELASQDPTARLELRNRQEADERIVLETAVLVAIVSGVASVIAGVLAVAREKRVQSVKVSGKSGWSVEIPADTPIERFREYVDSAREADIEVLEL